MEALFGHPILQSLLAGILSWISVSLGASAIFLRREFSRLAMDCMLGAAGGMMLGAAFLGLLQPAAEMASHMGRLHFIPIVCGLMAGAAFLMGLDHLLPHLHIRQKQQEGLSTSWRRSVLLVTAMALHHIPEGLTMGVGYGAVAAGSTLPSGVPLEMSSAFMVTGTTLLQNLPEGLVVATALRAEGFSAKRSWLCGVFSAVANVRLATGRTLPEILRHLEELGLAGSARRPVSQLSGGMRRRVAIARAVCAGPQLLLLDEAFKGLDDQCRRDTVAYIRRHTPGASLLCVTHDPEEAALLGGRCLDLSAL